MSWVRVDKDYRFETDEGSASLADLFKGRSQLLVYHFMFGPDYTKGCPSCSSIADGFNGIIVHLANHDVPLQIIGGTGVGDEASAAYARAMGVEREAYLARFSAPLPPRAFGDYLVAVLDDPQYAKGVAFGLKGDTGITVLEGEAA